MGRSRRLLLVLSGMMVLVSAVAAVLVEPSPALAGGPSIGYTLGPQSPVVLIEPITGGQDVREWSVVTENDIEYVRYEHRLEHTNGAIATSTSMLLFEYDASMIVVEAVPSPDGPYVDEDLLMDTLVFSPPTSVNDEVLVGGAIPEGFTCDWHPLTANCQIQICTDFDRGCTVLTVICCSGGVETSCARSENCGAGWTPIINCGLPGNPCPWTAPVPKWLVQTE